MKVDYIAAECNNIMIIILNESVGNKLCFATARKSNKI